MMMQVDGQFPPPGSLVPPVGSVAITLTTTNAPSNNNFALAYTIIPGQLTPTMTNVASTVEIGEPSTNGRSVWYR
jgi:hypothetical protein